MFYVSNFLYLILNRNKNDQVIHRLKKQKGCRQSLGGTNQDTKVSVYTNILKLDKQEDVI